MKRLFLTSLWFGVTCLFLIVTATAASYHYLPEMWLWQRDREEFVAWEPIEVELIPQASESGGATTADARAMLVANFIERNDHGHNSPLQPYDYWGKFFVEVADEYSLDFRLLPAIARKESTFCKSNIAEKYYNCFGYGVPASGITEAGKFSSYEEGIRTVAASLKRSYIDQGLTDPIAIMRKYCPPSAAGSGAWSRNINQWLAEMRYDDKSSGLASQENADLTEFIGAPATQSAHSI